jgi:hypothetical protein
VGGARSAPRACRFCGPGRQRGRVPRGAARALSSWRCACAGSEPYRASMVSRRALGMFAELARSLLAAPVADADVTLTRHEGLPGFRAGQARGGRQHAAGAYQRGTRSDRDPEGLRGRLLSPHRNRSHRQRRPRLSRAAPRRSSTGQNPSPAGPPAGPGSRYLTPGRCTAGPWPGRNLFRGPDQAGRPRSVFVARLH